MEREKLLEEYRVTLESLIDRTSFVYSEEYYKLDEFDKQKYQKDKMTAEAHLNTLCEILWGNKVQLDNGFSNLFALAIISSMFGGFPSNSKNFDYIKKTLDEETKKAQENASNGE